MHFQWRCSTKAQAAWSPCFLCRWFCRWNFWSKNGRQTATPPITGFSWILRSPLASSGSRFGTKWWWCLVCLEWRPWYWMHFLNVVEGTIGWKPTLESSWEWNNIGENIKYTKQWMRGKELDQQTDYIIVVRLIFKNSRKVAWRNGSGLTLDLQVWGLCWSWGLWLLLGNTEFHHC